MNSWNQFWSDTDPGFLEPTWLFVIPFFVVVFLLLEWGSILYRRQALKAFVGSVLLKSLLRGISPQKRFLKRALVLFGMICVLIALARPHLFFELREQTTIGTDILLAVDCSKSMLTADVKPSRLERAKLAISELADHLPGCRLGLIAFAGDAFLECPLTNDHDAFQNALLDLDTDTIPRPGTDISTAIAQGMLALDNQPKNRKVMILVTDGEDLESQGTSAAEAAGKQGLKIYCVGVGTKGGDRIPITDANGNMSYLQDSNGTEVRSHLDDVTLQKIAEATGGAYAPLGQQGEGLTEIYNKYFASMAGLKTETKRDEIPYEQFMWPLGLAVILLAIETLINEKGVDPEIAKRKAILETQRPLPFQRRRAKEAASVSAMILALCLLPSAYASTYQAESNYKDKKYQDALTQYEEAAKQNKDTLLEEQLEFNAGDAAYQSKNYSEAEDAFNKALHTKNLPLQEKTYYNLGNTEYRRGQELLNSSNDTNRTEALWENALKSYQSSLDLNPNNDSAKQNLSLVKTMLEELRKKKPPGQGSKPGKDPGDSQGDKTGDSTSTQDKPGDQDKPSPGSGQPQDPGASPGDKNGGNNPGNQQGNPDDQGSQTDNSKPGDRPGQQDKPGQGDSTAHNAQQAQQLGTSNARAEDEQDTGSKTKEEAIYLLDSLKDEEHHVSSRQMNDGNTPPPTASGKDW